MIGQEFADDIKELTGGAVEIEYYRWHAAALIKCMTV